MIVDAATVETITLETVTAWWETAKVGIFIVAFTCGFLVGVNL